MSTAREAILSAVRAALPMPAVDLPEEMNLLGKQRISSNVGYKGKLPELEKVDGFPGPGESLVPFFEKQLVAMGGRSFQVGSAKEAQAKARELFPKAKVWVSTAPEISANRDVKADDAPGSFADVDVAVVRSKLGVAEAAALWLDSDDLVVPALGVLAQNLIILLDPRAIVPTLHEAYNGGIAGDTSPYGVFMAGPSATGDIEGVIIHGAQGARSLTVLLLEAEEGRATASVSGNVH